MKEEAGFPASFSGKVLAASAVISIAPSAAAEQKDQDQPAAVVISAHAAIISIAPSATAGEEYKQQDNVAASAVGIEKSAAVV